MLSEIPPAAGVYDGSPLTAEAQRLRAIITRRAHGYATKAADHVFFCGATAAVLWGLPLPLRVLRPAAEDIDVAVIAPRRAPRGRGVRGHQLSTASVSVRDMNRLRLASPATVWAQLATALTVEELIAAGDAIVHIPRLRGMARGHPDSALGTGAQLSAAMSTPHRTGVGKLRKAYPYIRIGAASAAETELRLALLRGGLPEPVLDYDVHDANGHPIGFTEIAFPRQRVLVEREGDHHRTDRAQWNRDIDKHAACAAAGWTVIRVTSQHMHPSPEPAVTRVRDALLRAGWRP